MENRDSTTGYLHPIYIDSLSEFGTPRRLSKCGGWILQRNIPGFDDYDAMGCYPLFNCLDWSRLEQDLEDIGTDLVSLSVVTDPFGNYNIPLLQGSFKDLVIPFKEHFIVDLSRDIETFVSDHHSRYARKALRHLSVERCADQSRFLSQWTDLYSAFIAARNIKGFAAFSEEGLAKQLKVPGLTMFRAEQNQAIVGMHLWYVQGDVAYAHLAGYSDVGYKLGASYALFWSAIQYFTGCEMKWLHLGGVAGMSDAANGLATFKSGWSTGSRTTYLCGRIFDRQRYASISAARNSSLNDYFPAYRRGELS